MEDSLNEDVRAAAFEFQRYLMDEIPPLNAFDSVQTMIAQPPQLLMKQVRTWALEQSRLQSVSMSDLLFHALKKVQLMSNLKLLDRAVLDAYLTTAIPLALQICPPGERELLQSNLLALRDERSFTSATVDISRSQQQQQPAVSKVARAATDVVSRTARRLGLIIDRISRVLPKPAQAAPSAAAAAAEPVMAEPTISQLVTMAAGSSNTEEELEGYLQTLRPYAGDTQPSNLIKALASAIPAWDIPIPAEAGLRPSPPVEAMRKIVTLTQNAMEVHKRLREMIMTAVEYFNSGSLGPAVSMLEVADVVVREKKIDQSTIDRIRTDAVEAINAEQLKKYAENRSKHPLLRKALATFPTLTKESLLQQLRGEERPERRRALLGLLEAWGAEGREAALVELEAELNRPADQIDTYYLRNVIYLLHRIPREADATVAKELELLTRSSARGQSIYVIKEAVIPMGQIKSDAAVKVLTTRLAEFEAILVRKDISMYPMDEMQKLLDRIVAALARIGTPAALLTIARHGMKPNPLLGDTRGRLAALSQHDLSFDEQTVTLLVNTIREDLPNKLLGRILPKKQPPPVRLIEALSSTRSEVVEELFNEIAEKFPDQDVGRAATAALATLSSGGKQALQERSSALTGDLQFFGLPSLMQSLAENRATGIVTLTTKPSAQTAGKVLFVDGKFVEAQSRHLRGADALYQLLERPTIGTFAFVPQPSAAERARNEPHDVMGLLFEGIRRHDELKEMTMLVPDDMVLKATGMKPTPDPDEKDPAVVRDVWLKASSGKRVGELESEIAADPYRVRRLLARWIEEGSLQPAA